MKGKKLERSGGERGPYPTEVVKKNKKIMIIHNI